MKEFWDKRYQEAEYAYGEAPNAFFQAEIQDLHPGKILLPAEGEGRNAVYAAQLGWQVEAFDQSEYGKEKAQKLARKHEVGFVYQVGGWKAVVLPPEEFDLLGLFYVHLPADEQTDFHIKMLEALKPGGKVILEAFSEKQLAHSSGGPKSLEMLFSREKLRKDFSGLQTLQIDEIETVLQEGKYHRGKAWVIRLTGIK